MSEPKVILLCGSRLGIPILRTLVFSKQLAAIAIPDHCTEFIQQVQMLLQDASLPIINVSKKDCSERLQKAINDHEANMGIIVSFSFKISSAIFNLTVNGFFNVHPGLLPQYRGPDPVFQQLKNQERFAAIAIHKVDRDFDTGPIVLTDKIKIQPSDTHGILTTRLSELAATQVDILLKMAAFGIAIPTCQQDETKAAYYKRQTATDVSINWETMDAATIVALANACNPWNKGAITQLNGNIIRLIGVEKRSTQLVEAVVPGTILSIDNENITVATMSKELLAISFIYIEEGFLKPSSLLKMGIQIGTKFQ